MDICSSQKIILSFLLRMHAVEFAIQTESKGSLGCLRKFYERSNANWNEADLPAASWQSDDGRLFS